MSRVTFFIAEEPHDEDTEMRHGCEMEILQRRKWNTTLLSAPVKGEYTQASTQPRCTTASSFG